MAIHRLMDANGCVFETVIFLLVCEQFFIFPQRTLIALERENVIGLIVDDLLRDGALASIVPREELRNHCGGMILEGLNVFDIAGFGFVDKGFLAN